MLNEFVDIVDINQTKINHIVFVFFNDSRITCNYGFFFGFSPELLNFSRLSMKRTLHTHIEKKNIYIYILIALRE